MAPRCFKSLLVAVFSLCGLFFFNMSMAQGDPAAGGVETKKAEPKLDPSKIILEHIGDAHEFHFFTLNKKPVTIPLPVILYSPSKGWSVFMSSRFEHGAKEVKGYRLLTEGSIAENNWMKRFIHPVRS